jgi:hypothetical protein
MGWYPCDDNNNYNNNNSDASIVEVSRKRSPPSSITIADYTIGGLLAGLTGSVGQHFYMKRSTISTRIPSPGKYFGVGPGLGLGLMAGCLQAATDYGILVAKQAQKLE